MSDTETPEAPATWHGLSHDNELRLLRLQAIADRLDAIAAERDALYLERSAVVAEARLDPAGPAPVQLLADYSRVTDAAIQHQLRQEEERRELPRQALGRGIGKTPPA